MLISASQPVYTTGSSVIYTPQRCSSAVCNGKMFHYYYYTHRAIFSNNFLFHFSMKSFILRVVFHPKTTNAAMQRLIYLLPFRW
jgi:hypothetical protein